MRRYALLAGIISAAGMLAIAALLIPSSGTLTAQDKPLTPRNQPGTDMTIYSPKQHGLYDGKFRLSCGRTYVVGSLSDKDGWEHMDNAGKNSHLVEGSVEIDRAGRQLVGAAGEQLDIDAFGNVARSIIAADGEYWRWAEVLAPAPDIEGRPASVLLDWVARETGKSLHYADLVVKQRAASVRLHGNIRHLAPLDALDVMLATTDLDYVLSEGRIEIRARNSR